MNQNNVLGGSQAKGEGTVSNAPMKERVISERVVSEKVLGSSNPIARFGRNAGNQISSRIGGVLLGLVLIIVSFVVVWQSTRLEKSSDVVKNLPLVSVEQAVNSTGMVKVTGKMTSAPINNVKDPRGLIYYHHTKEALEMVRSTETETRVVTRDGQDIEQTVEKEVEKPEWVSKFDESKWADIVLDNKITISNPGSAVAELSLQGIYNNQLEKARENVDGVLAGDQLIVVGEIQNNKISGGKPFIISNKSDSALMESLVSSENMMWWIYKIAVALLFGFGLYLLLGPVLLILDIIPILGDLGKGVILVVSLLIGAIFTVFSSLLIAYWYICLILVILVIFYLVFNRKPKQQATV